MMHHFKALCKFDDNKNYLWCKIKKMVRKIIKDCFKFPQNNIPYTFF